MDRKSLQRLLILVVFVLGLLFYWFQIRPSNIKSECSKNALQEAVRQWQNEVSKAVRTYGLPDDPNEERYSQKVYENYYMICLQKKGL